MEWLWLILLGFGAGAYGVMVGAGGGFVLSPALLIFFDLEPEVVAGTSLALVASNSISGAIAFRRMGLVDRRSGLLFAGAAIPGSVLAPFVLTAVAGGVFRFLFGALLIALAAQMIVRPQVSAASPRRTKAAAGALTSRQITTDAGEVYRYEFNEGLATSINLFLGFIASFFGTGGGFLRTPILVYVFGFPVRVAVATSVFALSFYTTAGAITHASLGHVDVYPTFVFAGIGLLVGGQIGARLTGRVRAPWILRLLVLLLLGMGITLVVNAFQG